MYVELYFRKMFQVFIGAWLVTSVISFPNELLTPNMAIDDPNFTILDGLHNGSSTELSSSIPAKVDNTSYIPPKANKAACNDIDLIIKLLLTIVNALDGSNTIPVSELKHMLDSITNRSNTSSVTSGAEKVIDHKFLRSKILLKASITKPKDESPPRILLRSNLPQINEVNCKMVLQSLISSAVNEYLNISLNPSCQEKTINMVDDNMNNMTENNLGLSNGMKNKNNLKTTSTLIKPNKHSLNINESEPEKKNYKLNDNGDENNTNRPMENRVKLNNDLSFTKDNIQSTHKDIVPAFTITDHNLLPLTEKDFRMYSYSLTNEPNLNIFPTQRNLSDFETLPTFQPASNNNNIPPNILPNQYYPHGSPEHQVEFHKNNVIKNPTIVNPYQQVTGVGNNTTFEPPTETNSNILNQAPYNAKIIELTYLLHPAVPIYQPLYYVKYRVPYGSFANRKQQSDQQYLKMNPIMYQELIAASPEVSPALKYLNNGEILKLVIDNGQLVNTKILTANEGDDTKRSFTYDTANIKLEETESAVSANNYTSKDKHMFMNFNLESPKDEKSDQVFFENATVSE